MVQVICLQGGKKFYKRKIAIIKEKKKEKKDRGS